MDIFTLLGKITLDGIEKVNQQLSGLEGKMKSAGQAMTSMGKQMTMKVTAPLLALGTAGFKMAGDFDLAFRKVNVMLGASAEEAVNYKNRILEISSATGKSAIDVADAFYQIVSAGYRGSDALDILNIAMKGAVGGAADATATTAALTKAMNIFQLEGAEGSSRAMDTFFGIVDTGLLTFEEMALAFPLAATMAAGLGVEIEEVGAALGTLTKVSGSTRQASTALNAVFTQLIKPSADLQDLYEQWGVSTGPEAIEKFGGFEGVLLAVQKATGGNVAELSQLFPNVEAIRAILPLVTTNAGDFADALGVVKNSTGRTGEAFDEMAQGPGFQWQQMMATLKNSTILLGDSISGTLGPWLEKLMGGIKGVVDWFKNLSEGTQKTLIIIGALAAGIGPLLLILGQLSLGMAALIPLIKKVGTAIKVALAFTKTHPIILGIGLLITAGILLWKNWDKVQVFFERLWANMKIVFGSAVKFLVGTVLQPFLLYIDKFLGNIVRGVGKVVSIFNTEWGAAIENVADGMQNLGETITDWADGLIAAGEGTKNTLDIISRGAQEAGAKGEMAFRQVAEATEEVGEKAEEAGEKVAALSKEYEDYIESIEKLIEADEYAQTEAGRLGVTMEDLKNYMIDAGMGAKLLADEIREHPEIWDDVNAAAQYYGITLEDVGRTSEQVMDSMLRDIRAITGERKDAARESTRIEIKAINDGMKAHRNAHRDRMDDLRDEYSQTIKNIDAELDYALKGYESQLDAIDKQLEAIDDAEQGQRDAERKGELEASIAEEEDADKRIDLEDRLNELLIESDNKQWQDERTLAYKARIAQERDADESRRLEQRLADFRLGVRTRLTRKELENEKDALRQEMDMAREGARNAKDQAQDAYDHKRDLQEEALDEFITAQEIERDEAETTLREKLQNYDDDLTAFEALLAQKEADMAVFVAAFNKLIDEIKKEITITTILETITKGATAPTGGGGGTFGVGVGEEIGDTGQTYWGETKYGKETVSAREPSTYEAWEWYQHGGLVREPTLLTRLRDLKPYGIMAEKRPEYISPGIPTINITIPGMVIKEDMDVDRFMERVVSKLRSYTGIHV